MFGITAKAEDIPLIYAKVYLSVSYLDAALCWFRGNCATSLFPWIFFTIDLARVAIAYILFKGVPQRNVSKCKSFCVLEVILILIGLISLAIQDLTTVYIVWFIIVVVLRVYGLKLISTFISTIETEVDQKSTLPWTSVPEPVETQNDTKSGYYPVSPT